MANQEKKKLCWNCEGSVSNRLETCPYCGVYLSPNLDDKSPFHDISDTKIPSPPYQPEGVEEEVEDLSSPSQTESFALPLSLLLAGSVFTLFGLVVYFFSQDGYLALSWPENYGLYFMLIGIPALAYGIKKSQTI